MSKVGEKRSAEQQLVPEDVIHEEEKWSPTREEGGSAGGLGIDFRPSSLQKAASSLSTYSDNLKSPLSLSSTGGFLKLNSHEKLALPSFSSTHIMTPPSFGSLGRSQNTAPRNQSQNNGSLDSSHESNLFLQCLSGTSRPSTTSSRSTGYVFGMDPASRVSNPTSESESAEARKTPDESRGSEDSFDEVQESDVIRSQDVGQIAFGARSPAARLPEVALVTGEEGEKHIVQVFCKLFHFDSATRHWCERGRGEVRLNDAPQSFGVYQSRLLMRASGSLRLLLNTRLWAEMKCEKADPKSLRITAQDGSGGVGVYLLRGSSKDIQNLYSSVNRRLEALKKSAGQTHLQGTGTQEQLPSNKESGTEKECASSEETVPSYEEDDSVLGDHHSSPDSSPERQTERLEKPADSVPYGTPAQDYHSPGNLGEDRGTQLASQD